MWTEFENNYERMSNPATDFRATASGSEGMNSEPPSGSVVPVVCGHSKDIWPTCYGYIRGTNLPDEHKLLMRAAMVKHCEENELHLARIFHDWEVESNCVDYPGLHDTIAHAAQPDTHTLLLADLDFYDNPSHVLAVLAETITRNMPWLKVVCVVDERVWRSWRGSQQKLRVGTKSGRSNTNNMEQP
jgi:hypothetical protein